MALGTSPAWRSVSCTSTYALAGKALRISYLVLGAAALAAPATPERCASMHLRSAPMVSSYCSLRMNVCCPSSLLT